MFSIQTNVNSLIAQENLRVNSNFQSQTIQRLTSGYRINQSGDDAAGLAVANQFRGDIAELTQGVRNANDGLSQLQIIDGGLNNISKMLDRLKTLATQSGSSTFTGDRSVLNNEYTSLLGEINRQAANIGLGRGDTDAGRYNTDLKVYLGGGSIQTNSVVSVDLAASSNLVDSVGLSLDSTTVAGSTAGVTLTGGVDISGLTMLDSDSTQTFTFDMASGAKYNVTVTGDSAGIDATEVLRQLNNGLSGTGITASLDTAGKLQFKSSNTFAITSAAGAVGGGTAINAAIANNAAVLNTGMYRIDGGAFSDYAGGEDQVYNFTPTGGSTTQITITSGTNVADALVQLRNGLAGTGIDAVLTGSGSGTSYISFQSSSGFGVTVGSATGAATGGIANMADGDLSGAGATSYTDTDQSQSTDPTSDARAALTAISAAVTKLGTVQGKVGTGQNQLQYAINLAQSQISNFSAAESRIRDADIASEAANLTKAQVLQQASLAAMAQANSAPQAVLALLRG